MLAFLSSGARANKLGLLGVCGLTVLIRRSRLIFENIFERLGQPFVVTQLVCSDELCDAMRGVKEKNNLFQKASIDVDKG